VPRAFGQITFKEIGLMIPNLTARNSKKGGKAAPGQTAHAPRQWLGQDPLVHRTQLGMAPPISKAENPRRKISINP
jgi:hypothetical protein